MDHSSNIYTVQTKDREIIITRSYAAPRELVFQAWTAPEHVSHWWGPDGFTITTYEMDVRPGGLWKYMMHGPDGTEYPNKIVYEEVCVPEQLVYSHGSWDDEDIAGRFHVRVTFSEVEGGTQLNMQSIFSSEEVREMVVREYGAIEGGKQTLERLAQYLETNT